MHKLAIYGMIDAYTNPHSNTLSKVTGTAMGAGSAASLVTETAGLKESAKAVGRFNALLMPFITAPIAYEQFKHGDTIGGASHAVQTPLGIAAAYEAVAPLISKAKIPLPVSLASRAFMPLAAASQTRDAILLHQALHETMEDAQRLQREGLNIHYQLGVYDIDGKKLQESYAQQIKLDDKGRITLLKPHDRLQASVVPFNGLRRLIATAKRELGVDLGHSPEPKQVGDTIKQLEKKFQEQKKALLDQLYEHPALKLGENAPNRASMEHYVIRQDYLEHLSKQGWLVRDTKLGRAGVHQTYANAVDDLNNVLMPKINDIYDKLQELKGQKQELWGGTETIQVAYQAGEMIRVFDGTPDTTLQKAKEPGVALRIITLPADRSYSAFHRDIQSLKAHYQQLEQNLPVLREAGDKMAAAIRSDDKTFEKVHAAYAALSGSKMPDYEAYEKAKTDYEYAKHRHDNFTQYGIAAGEKPVIEHAMLNARLDMLVAQSNARNAVLKQAESALSNNQALSEALLAAAEKVKTPPVMDAQGEKLKEAYEQSLRKLLSRRQLVQSSRFTSDPKESYLNNMQEYLVAQLTAQKAHEDYLKHSLKAFEEQLYNETPLMLKQAPKTVPAEDALMEAVKANNQHRLGVKHST